MHSILETLMTTFSNAVLSVEADTQRQEITARVAPQRIVEIARWLHDTPETTLRRWPGSCHAGTPH
jgi:NADH-quinone oxidoreductase subunit C/D